MGAFLAIMASHVLQKIEAREEIMKAEDEKKDRLRRDVIDELSILEHCSSCNVKIRAEILVNPWIDALYPWNDPCHLKCEDLYYESENNIQSRIECRLYSILVNDLIERI